MNMSTSSNRAVTSFHSSSTLHVASLGPASLPAPLSSLPVELLPRVTELVCQSAPLCVLSSSALARAFSCVPAPESLERALAAARILSLLPSGGVAVLQRTDPQADGGQHQPRRGEVARMLRALVWLLERLGSNLSSSDSAPPGVLSSVLALVLQLASQPSLRMALRRVGALRALCRLATDTWARIDQLHAADASSLHRSELSAPSPLLLSLHALLRRTLLVLRELSEAASVGGDHGAAERGSSLAGASSPEASALLDRLARLVVGGPDECARLLALAHPQPHSHLDATINPAMHELLQALDAESTLGSSSASSTPASPPTLYLYALHVLGNFAAQAATAKMFLRSNQSTGMATAVSSAVSSPARPGDQPLAASPSPAPLAPSAFATSLSSPLSVQCSVPLRSLYRSLCGLLSSPSLELVLLSLRLLAHLAIGDSGATGADGVGNRSGSMERKLFGGANLPATFQLVFNLILSTAAPQSPSSSATAEVEQTRLLPAAIDLLLTLARSSSVLAHLGRFEHLAPSLRQLLRVAARSVRSGTTPAASSTLDSSSNVCAQLLSLCLALARCPPLRPVLRRVVFDASGVGHLASVWSSLFASTSSCSHEQLTAATLALRLLHGLAFDAAFDAAESEEEEIQQAQPSSTTLPPELLSALLSPSVAPSLTSLSRCLHVEELDAATEADRVAAHENELLDAAMDDEEQFSLTAGLSPFLLHAPSPAASSDRGSFTRRGVALLVARLYALLVSRAPHDTLPVLRHTLALDVAALLQSVQALSAVAEPDAASRSDELFALLQLLSLVCDAPTLVSLRTSIPLPALGACVAHALASEDVLHAAQAMHCLASIVLRPSSSSSTLSKAASGVDVQTQQREVEDCVQLMAQGVVSFNSSSSRDSSRVSHSLSALRSQLADTHASLEQLRRSSSTAVSEAQAREQVALQRVRAVEDQWRRRVEECERQIEEMKAFHAQHLAQAESSLQSRLASFHNAQQSTLDRLASLEAELSSSLQRSSSLESSLASSSSKLAKSESAAKIARGEASAARAELARVEAERVQLATLLSTRESELSDSKSQCAELAARHAHVQSDLSARLEDAYAKLLLLNRTLGESEKRAERAAADGAVKQQKIEELNHSLHSLRASLASQAATLRQAQADLSTSQSSLQRCTHELQSERAAHAESRLELTSLADERAHLSHQVSSLSSSLAHSRSEVSSWRARAEEAQSARDKACEELKAHQALAAMIHKLSGQATAQQTRA